MDDSKKEASVLIPSDGHVSALKQIINEYLKLGTSPIDLSLELEGKELSPRQKIQELNLIDKTIDVEGTLYFSFTK